MIEQIIVQSLRRLENRHHAFLGAAAMQDIPPEIITFLLGKDNYDFQESFDAIADAAEADGFPFVRHYTQGLRTEWVQQTPATACQIWNFARNLRYILYTEKTSLIIWDDKMINLSWQKINRIVARLKSNDAYEFFAFQLGIRGEAINIKLKSLSPEERKHQNTVLFEAIKDGCSPEDSVDVFLTHGINGYDETFVLSPNGAGWLLHCLSNSTAPYNFLDEFIKHELPSHAEYIKTVGKGVYCPTEIGFRFVREILPQGTTTDWAHAESEHFESSRRQIEPNYIVLD